MTSYFLYHLAVPELLYVLATSPVDNVLNVFYMKSTRGLVRDAWRSIRWRVARKTTIMYDTGK